MSINNIPVTKSNFKVKAQDHIVVAVPEKQIIHAETLPLDLIDEQEDFFVINKPAGLLTHPATTSKDTASVASIIANKIKFPTEALSSNRAGIIHRLDKNTSGLLIIVKNVEAQNHFSEIFQSRSIKKRYLAICSGIPKSSEFVIDKPIGRDPANPTKMRSHGIAAKIAHSSIVVLQAYKDSTYLLEVSISTGRTHQIRVHLASVGLPILGDATYGKTSPLIDRQALHAYYLSFVYKGKEYAYRNNLPSDMTAVLEKLK